MQLCSAMSVVSPTKNTNKILICLCIYSMSGAQYVSIYLEAYTLVHPLWESKKSGHSGFVLGANFLENFHLRLGGVL